jgi:hypothetical protein
MVGEGAAQQRAVVTDQASISMDLFSNLPNRRRISVWPMPVAFVPGIASGHFIPIFLDGDAAQPASVPGTSMN